MCAGVVVRPAEAKAVANFLDSLAGRPCALVLDGEPGIGKTTLWLAAVGQARERGFRVLLARPAAAESQLAYASVADLFNEIDAAVWEVLPEPQRLAIERVLLWSTAADVATDRRAIGAALLSVVERLAHEAPLVLAVDDLQWVEIPPASRPSRSPRGG